jgi:thiol-disulfide isomerase/thioredoxin
MEMIAIGGALLLAAGCASNGLAPVGNSRQPVPDLSLPTLDGKQIEISKLKGKVVILDFWATWCTGCLEGLPHLQAMAANADLAQRGLVALAIDEQEKPETIRPMIHGKHFTFTVMLDTDSSAGRACLVFSLPTTIIVGRDGLVDAVFSGWTQDTAQQIDEAVSQALNAPIR